MLKAKKPNMVVDHHLLFMKFDFLVNLNFFRTKETKNLAKSIAKNNKNQQYV